MGSAARSRPSKVQHHCPKKAEGGCRPANTSSGREYCRAHQMVCPTHNNEDEGTYSVHLKDEECKPCRNDRRISENKDSKEREIARLAAEKMKKEAEQDKKVRKKNEENLKKHMERKTRTQERNAKKKAEAERKDREKQERFEREVLEKEGGLPANSDN